MTPCRDKLGNLPCRLPGGHTGDHRSGLTVWAAQMPYRPRWMRYLTARETTKVPL